MRGAELVERALRFNRQELVDDAVHCVEGQAASGKIDLTGRRHHVRLLTNVEHERFAVGRDNRLKQGRDETHPRKVSALTELRIRRITWASDFVDTHQLDELVAACLIRRDDAFSSHVLEHPIVRIVGVAHLWTPG